MKDSFNTWQKNFKDTITKFKTQVKYLKEFDSTPRLFDKSLLELNRGFLDDIIAYYTDFFERTKSLPMTEIAINELLAGSIVLYLSEKENVDYNKIIDDAYEIGIKKNHDYGSKNITRFGSKGIYVRIVDKLERFKNLSNGKNANVVDEKVEDTLKDIINYCLYDVMLQNGVWD